MTDLFTLSRNIHTTLCTLMYMCMHILLSNCVCIQSHTCSLVRHIRKDERKYYESLLLYSREHLMVGSCFLDNHMYIYMLLVVVCIFQCQFTIAPMYTNVYTSFLSTAIESYLNTTHTLIESYLNTTHTHSLTYFHLLGCMDSSILTICKTCSSKVSVSLLLSTTPT